MAVASFSCNSSLLWKDAPDRPQIRDKISSTAVSRLFAIGPYRLPSSNFQKSKEIS
jgi:hypothetical protein